MIRDISADLAQADDRRWSRVVLCLCGFLFALPHAQRCAGFRRRVLGVFDSDSLAWRRTFPHIGYAQTGFTTTMAVKRGGLVRWESMVGRQSHSLPQSFILR